MRGLKEVSLVIIAALTLWPLSAGALNVAFPVDGGTGTSTVPSSGQILIGNSLGAYSPAWITAGTNISIATSSGGISISSTGGGGAISINSISTSTFSIVAGPGMSVTSSTGANGLGVITLESLGGGGGGSTSWVQAGGNLYTTSTVTNVGILTSAPSSTLHVVGTFRTSGVNTFDGAVNASSTLSVSGATQLQSTLQVLGQTTLQSASTTNVGVTTNFTLGSDTINDLTGTGIIVSGGALQASLGTTISPTEMASSDFGDFTCNGTTCTLDASYLTGNQTITLSGDVSGSGATAITTTIGSDKILESMLKAVDAAADEECLTYETTTGDFEWQSCGTGGGGGSSTDWVGSGSTLTVSSTYNLVNVYGTASSSDLRSPSSTLGTINGTISFTGLVNSSSTFTNSGATVLGSTLHAGGATNLASTLTVAGAVRASSTLDVTGNTVLGGTLGVGGATQLHSTLGVTGVSTFTGAVKATSTLEVTGQATLSSIQMGGDIINEFAGTGLTVSGNALQSTLGTSIDLASEVGSTILPIANGGTGTSTTPGALQVLVGNGNAYNLSTLAGGTNITVSQSTSTITVGLSGIVAIANGGTATSTIAADNGVFVSNGSAWRNAVLPSCSDPTTSKLLWNSTTYTFTCGSDQSGGGGGAGGSTAWLINGTDMYSTTTISKVGINNIAPSSSLHVTGDLRVTNGILNSLGAVGTPSYSFFGDANTGMWSAAADTLNFSTGGSERIRVNSSGSVGIGTTVPSSTLHVVGNFFADGYSRFTVASTSISDLYSGQSIFEADSGQVTWSDMPISSNATSTNYMFYVAKLDGKDMFSIAGKPNGIGEVTTSTLGVAVGTSTPSALLTVANSHQTTSTMSIGAVGTPACVRYRDSDDAGWTYATFLNGAVTYSQTACATFND